MRDMKEHSKVLKEADQCVKCGLCLPHCPTFSLTQDENQSPRGRISMVQGLASQAIAITPNSQAALESCLSCYRCQSVCPAEVNFSSIIETARSQWAPTPLGFFEKMTKLSWVRWVHSVLWGLDASYCRPFARKIGLIKHLRLSRPDALLPGPIPARHAFKSYYPTAKNTPKGEVMLFLGCFSQITLHPLLHSTITLLQQLGYDVHVPTNQTCCGALYQHTGHLIKAQKCQQQNQTAFQPSLPVLTFATGCQQDLKEALPNSIDIIEFLANISWPVEWTCAPLSKTFVIQSPCTATTAQKKATFKLLAKIPELTLQELPNTQCCGAAGLQMLTHPEQSDALGHRWQTELQKGTKIDGVLSLNSGCQMHLQRLCHEKGQTIPFLHPLALFLGQLALDKTP